MNLIWLLIVRSVDEYIRRNFITVLFLSHEYISHSYIYNVVKGYQNSLVNKTWRVESFTYLRLYYLRSFDNGISHVYSKAINPQVNICHLQRYKMQDKGIFVNDTGRKHILRARYRRKSRLHCTTMWIINQVLNLYITDSVYTKNTWDVYSLEIYKNTSSFD